MQRNTHYRGVVRPQGSARRIDPGQNAYAREQGLRRQAEIQAQRDAASRFRENAAVDGDDYQNIEDTDLVDITEEVVSQQARENSHGRRNASLIFSHRETPVYKFRDVDLKSGTCVELKEPLGKWKTRFVEIKSIWVSRSDGTVVIRGLPYTRTHNLRGSLEKKRNEVCQILEIDADDRRPDEAQALVEISPHQIVQVRALYKTNLEYPFHCYGNDTRWHGRTDRERQEQGPLTCRWKLCIPHKGARARKDNVSDVDGAYVRMGEAEVDKRLPNHLTDKELKFQWRRKTHRGGSYKPSESGQGQQFTFGDLFCGAGGASRGAVMAGLKLVFGVDNWAVACETWRCNFPGARMFEQHVGDWITDPTMDWRSHPIDILHLSPPCQPFSPLAYKHAAAGNLNDDARAALFSCGHIINKSRPRVFTLEQTFGLTQDTHTEYLNSLIQCFTSQGYSVRWKIIPLIEYGLPQTRKRLIMIGACPGEQLPPWPPATHAQRPTGSQKPWVSEAQAFRGLSRRDPLHDVARATVRGDQPRDGNVPFSRTVIGGGTQGVSHFSGLRDYTLREIACLQGFPVSHHFVGNKTQTKKQIGNAFPSCVAKAFYDHLIACLQQVDGVQRAPLARVEDLRSPAPRPVRQPQPVVLPRGLPTETQNSINGDLTEEEAFEFALQQSRSDSLPAAFVVPSVEEDRQYSPVSAVGPLLEQMSIAPSDHRAEVPADDSLRSRSRTLGRTASPGQGRHPEAASQKRSLDSMHDGEADDVMRKESPPKRERVHVVGDGGSNNGGVDDSRIPSRLARYVGRRRPHGAGVGEVTVGQLGRANLNGDQLEEMWTF